MSKSLTHKKLEMIKAVNNYIVNADIYIPMGFWKNLAIIFPEYKQKREIYKAVYDNTFDRNQFIEGPSPSSLSLDGILHFLQNGNLYNIKKDKGFTLIKAEAIVFNLFEFHQYLLENNLFTEDFSLIFEEEVIPIEIFSLNIFPNFSAEKIKNIIENS